MTSRRPIRLGVIGLGKAFRFLSKALLEDGRIEIVAGADLSDPARHHFQTETTRVAYADANQILADSNVEAVYIATPPKTHVALVCAAAAAGKHIMIEKPMSLSVAESKAMVDAADKAGVQLLVGHTHSFDRPILMASAIIRSGEYGPLRHMTLLNYNNFMNRPRPLDALSYENGGGAILNQGFHQIDVARVLGGGLVETVTGSVGFWNARYQSEGAYTAILRFRSGATASLVFSGYGHFDSDEFCGWVRETGVVTRGPSVQDNRLLSGAGSVDRRQRYHEHFGFVLASCEEADIRPTPEGVIIYREDGSRLVEAPVADIPRVEVVDELYRAIVGGDTPIHSGRWGLATQEVCEAVRAGTEKYGSRRLEFQNEYTISSSAGEGSLSSAIS